MCVLLRSPCAVYACGIRRRIYDSLPDEQELDGPGPHSPSLYSICIDFNITSRRPAIIRTKDVSIVRCEQIRLLK